MLLIGRSLLLSLPVRGGPHAGNPGLVGGCNGTTPSRSSLLGLADDGEASVVPDIEVVQGKDRDSPRSSHARE
jgi:hypothetical protein